MPKLPREWLNRMQTVCFSPMANLNGQPLAQNPRDYPEVTDAVRDVIKLRMRVFYPISTLHLQSTIATEFHPCGQ